MILAHANPVEHLAIAGGGVAVTALYLRAWSRGASRSTARAVAFCVGVAIVVIALSPTIESFAESSFTGHMIQHLLLYGAAPPLLVMARPFATITGGRNGRRLLRMAHGQSWMRRSHARFGRPWPIFGVVASIAVLYSLHLTPLYDLALDDTVVHALTHAGLLAAGLLAWGVALRPGVGDGPLRFGAAFFMSVPIAILGLVLTTSSTPLSKNYTRTLGATEALRDQHAGGALMWIGAMLLGAALVISTLWRWASHEQRIAERTERTERAERVSPTESAARSVSSRVGPR